MFMIVLLHQTISCVVFLCLTVDAVLFRKGIDTGRVGDDCSSSSTIAPLLLCWFYRRWSSFFLYLFLFGYSCTSWIGLDSMQFCGTFSASRMHSGTWTTRFLRIRSTTLARSRTGKPADQSYFFLLQTFSTVRIFHSTSFDFFFPFFFVPESHTVPKGHVLRRPSGRFRTFACPKRY